MTATVQGPTRIDLSWSAPSDDGGAAITAYDVRHIETAASDKADANWTLAAAVWTTGSGALRHSLMGLTGSTQYDVQVRAVNAAGPGAWSSTATGTTGPPEPPGAPARLRAVAVAGQARVDLSWTAPADNGGAPITGYKIEASDDNSDPWTEVVTTTGAGTSYADDGTDSAGPTFEAGTTRYYRVSAINSAGQGEPAAVVTTEDIVSRYDTNKNGKIDAPELSSAISSYAFGDITASELSELILRYATGT